MNVLIIDNYDSFTYNLYQYMGEILTKEKAKGAVGGFTITVKRNNEITLEEVKTLNPDRIIISPGPGSPEDEKYFGVCAEVIAECGKITPLLGVCLGMQGIVHVFGGKIVKGALPVHGKTSPILHDASGIFAGTPQQLDIMRYHSLVAEPAALPACLELTAVVYQENIPALNDIQNSAAAYEIMAVKHRDYPITGIQFHPESFATEGGKDLLRNFLMGS